MKRIILIIVSLTLLFTACHEKEPENSPVNLVNTDTASCTIEQIAFPFGEWEFGAVESYMWDCFQEEQYYIFEGNKENESDVYQYKIYSYDFINETWKESDFQWNALLKQNHVDLLGNYQADKAGNIYFLGCETAHEGKEQSEERIYCIDTNGTLAQMDSGKKLLGEDETIRSFRLLEDGNFLVTAESKEDCHIYHIDFLNEKVSQTSLPAGVDTMIALNVLCIADDQVVYPYRQGEKECAVQFRKYKEKVPEKIVVFDYDFSEQESVYLWNIGKSVQGEAYMLASKGIYEISGDTAKQILGANDLSPMFDKYNDVIYTMQADEGEYFCVVQNDKDIALFKIEVTK